LPACSIYRKEIVCVEEVKAKLYANLYWPKNPVYITKAIRDGELKFKLTELFTPFTIDNRKYGKYHELNRRDGNGNNG